MDGEAACQSWCGKVNGKEAERLARISYFIPLKWGGEGPDGTSWCCENKRDSALAAVAALGERPLAPGWIEPNGRRPCSRCGDSTGRQFYICSHVAEATACERCAPFMGVFVTPPIVLPSAEPRQSAATVNRAVDALAALVPKALPRCGKCSHAGHPGPCGGTSPNGDWSCPCGDLTAKDARDAARGAYAVGTYSPGRDSERFGKVGPYAGWAKSQRGVATNLAREKPEARELPKVRSIYMPGASDDGDDRLGWTR